MAYSLLEIRALLSAFEAGQFREAAKFLRDFFVDGNASPAGATLTFQTMPKAPTTTVAATGTNQATAAALSTGFNLVTAADATKGVVLPAASAGLYVEIANNANAVLEVYPNTSDKIDGGSANGAFSVPAYGAIALRAYDATDWFIVGSHLQADVAPT